MLLELKDVHVHYGKIEALKGVSLQVGEGEIVSLIGGNGAGKTTTLKTISGLRSCSAGSVFFEGADIGSMPGHKRVLAGIGQAPEGRGIFPGMTVHENLLMGAYARKDDHSKELAEAYELFPRLAERRSQAAGTMSGGEQQMLAIGRALLSKPKVLLLDEPSMGLAPMLVQQIFSIIEEINRRGTTILLVEQNAQQALRLAHRAYVLETGRIVRSAPASELLDDPQVRAAYLGGDVGGDPGAVAAPGPETVALSKPAKAESVKDESVKGESAKGEPAKDDAEPDGADAPDGE
ncbi:ABC transporter ATP-binding protein [Actinomadura verrucosospora]|uniref:Amino acid ABC transporter ATPase n=1 Tax=Actinomadura verrucosospora TaxID=46165 RepID=A0A7D4A292_ACTVE|nr:ABC transporter ATP-binding protein [Actinomadura verrucosospora]QKG26726.1 amino acid ABC transporter ATPase [Actinomadura verrucosospora]